MDTIDRRILALFQKDTRLTADTIGTKVGLSAAAVQRRIKRLRQSGAIRAEVAILDPARLGIPVTCIVLVTVAPQSRREQQRDRFLGELKSQPQVQQCYHVTGASDVVVIVTASSLDEYREFARRSFEANATVSRYETLVVLDRVKAGLSLPL